MTSPEEFAEKMRNIPKVLDEREARRGRGWGWDAEDSHELADQYMCELLVELGYGEGVDIFKDMPKWYA